VILFQKQKKFIFFIGLVLVVSAIVFLVYTLSEIESREILLNYSNFSEEERWKAVGSLQWWKDYYSTTTVPATIFLFLSGLAIILSQKVSLPPRASRYLKTKNAQWYLIVIFFTIATILVVFGIPENFFPLIYLRYVFGGVFTFWLPGYCFIRALFVDGILKKSSKEIDSVERIALSLGTSLGIVALVGLFVNETPWGINLSTLMFGLLAITIVFATIAIIREYEMNMSGQSG
jgi:hypothetical protein